MDPSDSMQELFHKYLNNQCSPEEVKELLAYFNNPEFEPELRELISETLESIDADDDGTRWSPATDESFVVIKKQLTSSRATIVPLFNRSWTRIAVAAILVAGAFGLYNLIRNPDLSRDLVKVDNAGRDLAPGNNRATLTLADGSMITLENAANGTITQQGNTRIVKSAQGKLDYKSLNEKPTEILFNKLATPRGGNYQVILSDGSKVWLNAASSIRFPTAFSGTERRVELTGEAYFEIARNPSQPFKVSIQGKGEVEVLGTHFNVNAYSDESTLETTLLEGLVKISTPGAPEARILNPGEQAQVNKSGEITINKYADTELVTAWKNGTFHFINADPETVFRQLSRWYDVDIVFEGPIPEKQFNGEIQKDLKLSQVLKLLEKNNLSCRLDGKKLIVKKS